MGLFTSFAKYASITAASVVSLYAVFILALTTEFCQRHVVYLHKVQMTWGKDLDTPEVFGFLHNQVTPFSIHARSGESLYAWHILPIELYRKHEADLLEDVPGHTSDITTKLGFKLLQTDPDAYLIIHLHGAAGTVGSGYRVPNYRALSAGDPNKIHVLTFDYQGFGRSTGTPSEEGVLLDAVSAVEWAINTAKIPASRIILFGRLLSPPVTFVGHVLVAPFTDAASLMATYQIAGTIPLLGPIARFPSLFEYLKRYLRHKWSSKDRIASFIRTNEANDRPYLITIIHAEDDYDIPSAHSQELFWQAVTATSTTGVSREALAQARLGAQQDLGPAGTVMQWKTSNGVIREELLKTGLHDVMMGNPVVTLAVMRLLDAVR